MNKIAGLRLILAAAVAVGCSAAALSGALSASAFAAPPLKEGSL